VFHQGVTSPTRFLPGNLTIYAMVNMIASEVVQSPMKVDLACVPPPGLEHPTLQQIEAPSDKYTVGEEVLALRSNGSWSKGTVTELQNFKIVVAFKEGVKHIRKENMERCLKKAETSQPMPLKEALLAEETAILELENARLKHENMMMRMQSQKIASVSDARMAYPSQDPHGYIKNPSGSSQAACPTVCDDDTTKKSWASKWLSKVGVKENSNVRQSSWSSDSTASGGHSCGLASISEESEPDIDDNDVADTLPHSLRDFTLPHERTTVMMRNIPNNASRKQLIGLLDAEGYQGRYNLIDLPIDLRNKVGLGYAFINFVTNEDAQAFSLHFQGFKSWGMQSEKVAAVTWSDAMQGLDEHVERYRDCPVMHESIPDEFKPLLFKDGVRVPFPKPTKKIQAPRPWSRRHS
jgi:hypothetical protein